MQPTSNLDIASAPGLPTSRMGHARILLVIAVPLIGAYLAELAIFNTTKIIVGRLGYLELAAVGIAGDLTFEIMIVLMGLLSVVGVFVAEAEGGDNKVRRGGKTSGYVKAAVDRPVGFGTLMQSFNAAQFRGKAFNRLGNALAGQHRRRQ